MVVATLIAEPVAADGRAKIACNRGAFTPKEGLGNL